MNKKKIVFQAGYSDGCGTWYVCGYGSTQILARKDLENRLSEKTPGQKMSALEGRYQEQSSEQRDDE